MMQLFILCVINPSLCNKKIEKNKTMETTNLATLSDQQLIQKAKKVKNDVQTLKAPRNPKYIEALKVKYTK